MRGGNSVLYFTIVDRDNTVIDEIWIERMYFFASISHRGVLFLFFFLFNSTRKHLCPIQAEKLFHRL